MRNTPVEPYGTGPYHTTPDGTTTPYGQLPPPPPAPPGSPSSGMPPAPPTPPEGPPQGPKRPRGRRVAGMLAVAVVAAAVGGGVGGYIGHESTSTTANGSSVGTLNQPLPKAGDLPEGAISTVAQRVLPSVVQLQGSAGEGSGFVLSSDGLILTNAHVLSVAQGGQLIATFQDGTTKPVREVGRDTRADLAVVRAEDVSGLTPIQLGNSDGLKVGQQVVAVGSPLGLAGTVTSGIVSALNRPVEASDQPNPGGSGGSGGPSGPGGPGGLGGLGSLIEQAPPASVLDAIQTDAAINPGNSGGPLVDMQGRVVGINSAIASNGSTGLGFAIPINQAKRIADELVQHGKANQAQLGVGVRDSTPSGARLVSVQPGSAADNAGLKPGDVVIKIGDRRVADADALVAAINSATPGGKVTLTVTSGAGAARSVDVTLGSVPAD